jgi:hypothetical protein
MLYFSCAEASPEKFADAMGCYPTRRMDKIGGTIFHSRHGLNCRLVFWPEILFVPSVWPETLFVPMAWPETLFETMVCGVAGGLPGGVVVEFGLLGPCNMPGGGLAGAALGP